MEVVKRENQEAPTPAQVELAAAQKKERDECWQEVQNVLQKYQYRFSAAMNISDKYGVGFIIDIVKLEAQPVKQ